MGAVRGGPRRGVVTAVEDGGLARGHRCDPECQPMVDTECAEESALSRPDGAVVPCTLVSNDKPHSADYFGPQRDFWWNDDFLDLMARRWRLGDHVAGQGALPVFPPRVESIGDVVWES